MACEIVNYEQMWSNRRFEEEAQEPGRTTVEYADRPENGLPIRHWLWSDEAEGWCYFANHRVLFSHLPTAVAFKMRFG